MIEKVRFVEVEVPMIGQTVHLLAKELKELENKTITMDLTRSMRGKSVEAIFRLHVENDKVLTEIERLHVFPFFIRRMMRKSIDYVEDSFEVQTKDKKLRVKPFLITRRKVHRSVRTALKAKAQEEIKNYFKDKTAETIFQELLSGRFQKSLSLSLKKIYPLTFCDIRDAYVEIERKIEITK